MPLMLDARSLSRLDERRTPLHRQLADLIRVAIQQGFMSPGETLPSEQEIADTSGLSRNAVRDALDILVGEGLVVKRAGALARVATPPPVRHMMTSRYQDELDRLRELGGAEHPATSAFSRDHGVDLDAVEVAAEYVEEAAGERDAGWLQVPVGEPVLCRDLLKYVAGEPVQLQQSVIPLRLVSGTPVADPARQPWPGGTIAELHSVGLVVTRVIEEARARTPTAGERRSLDMETPGPVWDVTRVFYAEDEAEQERPVEVSTVIVPADRLVLSYETALS